LTGLSGGSIAFDESGLPKHEVRSLQVDAFGGIIMGGNTWVNNSAKQPTIYHLANSGSINWAKRLDQPGTNADDLVQSVLVMPDSSYFLIFRDGNHNSTIDVGVAKFSQTGNFLWQKSYGTLANSERATGAVIAPNGNIAIFGDADGNLIDENLFFLEINPNSGAILQTKIYEAANSYTSSNGQITLTSDGYLVPAFDKSSGQNKAYLLKVAYSGDNSCDVLDVVWAKNDFPDAKFTDLTANLDSIVNHARAFDPISLTSITTEFSQVCCNSCPIQYKLEAIANGTYQFSIIPSVDFPIP
jgi:hypothetical protein